jgi:hypothetical protein
MSAEWSIVIITFLVVVIFIQAWQKSNLLDALCSSVALFHVQREAISDARILYGHLRQLPMRHGHRIYRVDAVGGSYRIEMTPTASEIAVFWEPDYDD